MGTTRQFIDSGGFAWQVWEVDRRASFSEEPARASSLSRDRCLYFFCRGTTRVLREAPVAWDQLTWSDLEDLCMSAELLGFDRVSHLASRPATLSA